MARPVTSFAPGRVNLIGDHTDYNGGVALPMAIHLGITVRYRPTDGDRLDVESTWFGAARLPLTRRPVTGAPGEPATDPPAWARLVMAVADLARPRSGGVVDITSSLPPGAGLSSSAALCVAMAQAFGIEGTPLEIARVCRTAEHRIGAPVGLMDPWVCAGGRAGHALLLDFTDESSRHVALPETAEWVVVDSERPRSVRTSAYLERVAECEAAAAVVGPLGAATFAELSGIRDPLLRRRARHVVSECARVHAMAHALAVGDLVEAGRLMSESHRSLSSDFEVSTPELDELVDELAGHPGVLGARLTGAGFGGCVIVLGRPGALDLAGLGLKAWRVTPAAGAYTSGSSADS